MNKNNWFAIILAGGSGERLWPLSRALWPKQLLSFNGNSSLLQMTIDRVAPLIPKKHRLVITTAAQEPFVRKTVGATIQTILGEPSARNTAAAIAWACLSIEQQNPHGVALILSADHYIPDQDVFLRDLEKTATYAEQHNAIALLGIKPTTAATGYGYIEYDPKDTHTLHKVLKFREKPSQEKAEQYVTAGNFLWNTGMFCGKVSTFIQEFEKHAPHILAQVRAFMAGKGEYSDIEKISFDHAVMEKSNATCVLPATFKWSDVGNLDIFLTLQGKTQEASKNVFTLNAHNNLVDTTNKEKCIALIGVDDLCIVDTPDALLVAKRADVEKVKNILQQIRDAGKNEIL